MLYYFNKSLQLENSPDVSLNNSNIDKSTACSNNEGNCLNNSGELVIDSKDALLDKERPKYNDEMRDSCATTYLYSKSRPSNGLDPTSYHGPEFVIRSRLAPRLLTTDKNVSSASLF